MITGSLSALGWPEPQKGTNAADLKRTALGNVQNPGIATLGNTETICYCSRKFFPFFNVSQLIEIPDSGHVPRRQPYDKINGKHCLFN